MFLRNPHPPGCWFFYYYFGWRVRAAWKWWPTKFLSFNFSSLKVSNVCLLVKIALLITSRIYNEYKNRVDAIVNIIRRIFTTIIFAHNADYASPFYKWLPNKMSSQNRTSPSVSSRIGKKKVGVDYNDWELIPLAYYFRNLCDHRNTIFCS